MTIIWCIALWQIWTLFNFWMADQAFALAQNYNRIGQYEQGFKNIRQAIALRSDEPTFAEELATSDAVIAVSLAQQKQELAKQQAEQLANEAMTTINQLTTTYPNNINFLKSQVRVYYTLSQLNPAYLNQSLEAMKKAAVLAPTDAKIWYNLGVLYGQTGNGQKGIEVLQKTITLKPDYREAYFALGLFYHDLAIDPKTNRIIKPELQEKAIEQMQFILTHFNPKDKQVLDTLKSWNVNL
jgi:tetratricopeptide (TPR) repeat protein